MATATTTTTTTATGRIAWQQASNPATTVYPNGKAHSGIGYNGTAYAITTNGNGATYNLHRQAKGKAAKAVAMVQASSYAACYAAAVAHSRGAAAKGNAAKGKAAAAKAAAA